MIKLGSSFKAQVLTVISGTAVAQALSLLLMPVLTRLFTPGDFGIFAICSSFISLLSLLTTFRLENAILLPKQESEAEELMALGIWCSVISCFIFSLILSGLSFFFGAKILPFATAGQYVFYITANCLMIGIANLFGQWHIRHSRFHVFSRRVILDRASFVAISLLLVNKGPLGLILGQLGSSTIVAAYLVFEGRKYIHVKNFLFERKHLIVLRSYTAFSVKHGIGTLLQIAAWQAPQLLISTWFSIDLVGKYNLAVRILEAPLTLIGNSFSGVFYRKISASPPENRPNLLRRVLKPLIIFPPVPLAILSFFAPSIFALAFGDEWRQAGVFFAALTLLYWWRLIYIACSSLYLVLNRLGMDAWIALALLVSQVSSVYIGYYLFGNLTTLLVLTSILTTTVVGMSVFWIYREVSLRASET